MAKKCSEIREWTHFTSDYGQMVTGAATILPYNATSNGIMQPPMEAYKNAPANCPAMIREGRR
jgi:hypothetical protein